MNKTSRLRKVASSGLAQEIKDVFWDVMDAAGSSKLTDSSKGSRQTWESPSEPAYHTYEVTGNFSASKADVASALGHEISDEEWQAAAGEVAQEVSGKGFAGFIGNVKDVFTDFDFIDGDVGGEPQNADVEATASVQGDKLVISFEGSCDYVWSHGDYKNMQREKYED